MDTSDHPPALITGAFAGVIVVLGRDNPLGSLTQRYQTPRALSRPCDIERSVCVETRPGRIQLRFWMILAAVLGADAAAIYAVHALVVWVRRVLGS